MALTITTNNVPRYTIDWHDLTSKEQREFNYLNTEDKQCSTAFFRYKGVCYDAGEFMHVPTEFGKWDGYHGDSYFSGIVIRYVGHDMEKIICGTYYS